MNAIASSGPNAAGSPATAVPPNTGHPQRWVWGGVVVTVMGVLSYFFYIVQFPDLRDLPILNVAIVVLGVGLAVVGAALAFKGGSGALSKGVAVFGVFLTLSLAGLFNYYVFVYSYGLPEAAGAPATASSAPAFSLTDQHGQALRLSQLHGKKAVVVFYRGFW